jgi:hypothetical protein
MSIKGWVYIITNRAMPGLVKVGFSLKDPLIRAAELENAGVPHPFHVEHKVLINAPRDTEQQIHRFMRDFHEGKEWFRCSVAHAIQAVGAITGNRIYFEETHVSNAGITEQERRDIENAAAKTRELEREERAREFEEAERTRAKFAMRKQRAN